MYGTVKELHIEIENRIQQITSNRHRSIAPQFIDMVLNRTAIKYIQSKSNRKTNYKGEGLEDSKKRVDDIQSLKRETGWMKLNIPYSDPDFRNNGFVLLPSDCLKFVGSISRYEPTGLNDNRNINLSNSDETEYKNLYYTIFDLSNLNISNYTGSIKYDDRTISLNDIIELYNTDSSNTDLFEIADLIIDRINNQIVNYNRSNDLFNKTAYANHLYGCYWEHLLGRYYKNCIIFVSYIHRDDIVLNIGGNNLTPVEYNTQFKVFKRNFNNISGNDLVSSENINAIHNNYYMNKRRYLNPMSEILDDRLFVYFDDNFVIDSVNITYIKKPILFNSDINQMSDMEITPEFMDMVVSDILLMLKDNSYQSVKQQSNIE